MQLVPTKSATEIAENREIARLTCDPVKPFQKEGIGMSKYEGSGKKSEGPPKAKIAKVNKNVKVNKK